MKPISRAITKFCYNHPRFGISRLPLILAVAMAFSYLIIRIDTSGLFLTYTCFNAEMILRGQVWRLVTWILLYFEDNIIFAALTFYFTYAIGSALENVWGSGKLTCYYITGVLGQIVVGLLMFFVFRTDFVVQLSLTMLTAVYINLSLFFAYAAKFPDNQLMLFFVIPLKAKYLAWAMAVWYGYSAARAVYNGLWPLAVPIVVAALNFLLVVGIRPDTDTPWFRGSIKQFKNSVKAAREMQLYEKYLHKCEICGRTDVSDPTLEFRYCTRCDGYKCYCAEHINAHKHVERKT